MAFEESKSAFDRDGFVVVRQLIDKADLDELRENLARYISEVVPGLPDSHAFYQDRERPETLKQMQFMGVDPYFRDYPLHPRWQMLAETLIGEPLGELPQPEWFNKPPGTQHVTPPHQDNYYFNLRPANVVTVWMALDPVDEENGCLRYVRGSYRQGLRPHGRSGVLGFSQGILDYGPDDERQEQRVCLEPGDVAAHHGETIHRADANRSPARTRRAFAIVYKGVSCRLDQDAFERYQRSVQSQHKEMGLKT